MLGGCGGRSVLPRVLYIAIGTNSDQTINAELHREFTERLTQLAKGFQRLHPHTSFQFSVYPEGELIAEMGRRHQAGLEPDLLFVNGDTAVELLRAGLAEPFPASAELLASLEPLELARMRTSQGELAGLPVLSQVQVSCFNRSRLARAPASVEDLLAASASGHPVGLSVDFTNLFWSAGSLGALPGIARALRGGQPSPLERQQIERWLAWLQDASSQQWVTFYGSQQSVEREFRAGRVDWLPCRSTALPQLRQALGSRLGVAPLPTGPGGAQASPINRLRVWALGSNSTPSSRRLAIAFGHYSVNPLVQRDLTLGSQTVLPANRYVRVPVQSSSTLRAMATAGQQGRLSNRLLPLLRAQDPRRERLETVIRNVVFGEMGPAGASDQLIAILRNPQAGATQRPGGQGLFTQGLFGEGLFGQKLPGKMNSRPEALGQEQRWR